LENAPLPIFLLSLELRLTSNYRINQKHILQRRRLNLRIGHLPASKTNKSTMANGCNAISQNGRHSVILKLVSWNPSSSSISTVLLTVSSPVRELKAHAVRPIGLFSSSSSQLRQEEDCWSLYSL